MGEALSCSSKAFELNAIQRVLGLVRAGQMADQRPPFDGIRPAQLLGKPVKFSKGQPEAAHTRIDMHHRGPFPVPRGGGSPIRDLPGIVEDRNKAEFDKIIYAAGQQTVQDGDLGRFGHHLAKCDPFIDGRDEKSPASAHGQGRRHQCGAQAVGVGLDHGCASGRVNPPRQEAPIRRYPCEIDFEDGARAVGGIGCDLLQSEISFDNYFELYLAGADYALDTNGVLVFNYVE